MYVCIGTSPRTHQGTCGLSRGVVIGKSTCAHSDSYSSRELRHRDLDVRRLLHHKSHCAYQLSRVRGRGADVDLCCMRARQPGPPHSVPTLPHDAGRPCNPCNNVTKYSHCARHLDAYLCGWNSRRWPVSSALRHGLPERSLQASSPGVHCQK